MVYNVENKIDFAKIGGTGPAATLDPPLIPKSKGLIIIIIIINRFL